MDSMHQYNYYQIYLEGILDERWLRWFDGLEVIASPDDKTIIRGEFDHSALQGLFNRIFDLGVTILSVQCIPEPGQRAGKNQDGLFFQ